MPPLRAGSPAVPSVRKPFAQCGLYALFSCYAYSQRLPGGDGCFGQSTHPDDAIQMAGARAMTRQIAAALLAAVLAIGGLIAACSSSHPRNQVSSPSPSAVTPSADPALDADDACDNLSAQEQLAQYAETDFTNAFNARSPDMGAKGAALAAAESNAVQQVSNGMSSDVPDPPLGAIRTWMDAARAYISALQTQSLQNQSGLVAVYKAHHKALMAYNAAAEACEPTLKKRLATG
jgi:hypothetical protein